MESTASCETHEPVTIADQVYSRLRSAILEGEIAPGSKISEQELANAYGVSRGSLREAIGRLEASNLVVRRPNVGARVISLSSEQLLEIYQIREALEGMAARLAAEQMEDDEISELKGILKKHQCLINEDYSDFQKKADLDFHFCIIKGSHNKRLIRVLCNDLYDLVRIYRFQFNIANPRPVQAFDEHNQIVTAIERHDGEMAELLMRHHIRASRENADRSFRSAQKE